MYVIGIDFGGGASKATLLRRDGKVAAVSTVEYPTSYPKPGFAEQDPLDWCRAAKENIAQLFQMSGVKPEEIEAVCLDAATHIAVLMDERFRPLRPAIYWTDTRTVKQAGYLKEHHQQLILKQALHTPGTIWTLPQLMWVRENEPEVWKNTKRILFAKDFVRHQLTGDYLTDTIEAQGSMLFDCEKMQWSPELCQIAGLDPSILPEIVQPFQIAGTVTKQAADDTGLKEGTRVLCGTTDTVMEVFAAGAVKPGQMTVKLATAGRICVVTQKSYPDPNLVNYSHVVQGLWYPGTATKSSAASYRWYRDTFGEDYRKLDRAAQAVEPGCGGLLFHPYLNGELTPYNDPSLCGSFTGIRAGHTKAHFSRAVLEGVAFSLLDCKMALEQIGIFHETEAAIIGGGAASSLWCEIVADVLGLTLNVKENSDSSFGSAMLAGITAGFFVDFDRAQEACVKTVSCTEPNESRTKLYQTIFQKYRAVHDALAPIYHEDFL